MRRWGVALVLGVLSLATTARAGFAGAEWAMTPEAVAAASPQLAKLGPGAPGDHLDGQTVGNVGAYVEGNEHFRVVYYYRNGGLIHVSVDLTAGDCKVVIGSLLSRYGKPLLTSDQVILKLVIWHDPKTDTRVRLLLSKSICDINYERLEDYAEHDKAVAGSP